MSRLFSIEPVGILKAWTTKVRTNSARITATQIDSKYSRAVDLRNVAGGGTSAGFAMLFGTYFQNRQKRLLRNLDAANPLHPLLAFLLFLQKLAFPGDVTTITLREDVFPQGLY